MKKMLLIGMLVIGGLSYAKDNNTNSNQKQKVQIEKNVKHEAQAKVVKKEHRLTENQLVEDDFQSDLLNQSREDNRN